MSYECMDCGAEFETPAKAINPSGCPDEPEIDTCPSCGSDDIAEVDDYDDDFFMDDVDSMRRTKMRRYLALACILSYAVLGVYDLATGRLRMGAAETLLAVINTILFL